MNFFKSRHTSPRVSAFFFFLSNLHVHHFFCLVHLLFLLNEVNFGHRVIDWNYAFKVFFLEKETHVHVTWSAKSRRATTAGRFLFTLCFNNDMNKAHDKKKKTHNFIVWKIFCNHAETLPFWSSLLFLVWSFVFCIQSFVIFMPVLLPSLFIIFFSFSTQCRWHQIEHLYTKPNDWLSHVSRTEICKSPPPPRTWSSSSSLNSLFGYLV